MSALSGTQPSHLWKHLAMKSEDPDGSGMKSPGRVHHRPSQEKQPVRQKGQSRNVMSEAATAGWKTPRVILQDTKTWSGRRFRYRHDFLKEAISPSSGMAGSMPPERLGADNGIGVKRALASWRTRRSPTGRSNSSSRPRKRPPDRRPHHRGRLAQGKYLLNLDSEEEDAFTSAAPAAPTRTSPCLWPAKPPRSRRPSG